MIYNYLIKNGKKFRKYDENKVSINEVFIIETEFKWKELIGKNFKINKILCKNKNKLKLKYEKIGNFLKIKKNSENQKIIEKQFKDIKYIFEKRIDIFYIIPKLCNENDFYYFNIITIMENTENNEKKIKDLENKKFDLIEILVINEIKKEEISYNLIEENLKINKNVLNDNIIEFEEDDNENSEKYKEKLFKLVCLQIYSFDKIELNSTNEKEEFGLDFNFVTNYNEETGEIDDNSECFSTLSDNLSIMNVSVNSFKKF